MKLSKFWHMTLITGAVGVISTVSHQLKVIRSRSVVCLLAITVMVIASGCAGSKRMGHDDYAGPQPQDPRTTPGNRPTTIGIAVIPSTKGGLRKKLMKEAQEVADLNANETFGITVGTLIYGGPLAVAALPVIGATIGLVEGGSQLWYHSKGEVRKTRSAVRKVLKRAEIEKVISRKIRDRINTRTVLFENWEDHARLQRGEYKYIAEKHIDVLVVLDEVWMGLLGSADAAQFGWQANVRIVDLEKDMRIQRKTIVRPGSEMKPLEKWREGNAAVFLQALEQNYDSLVQGAVSVFTTYMDERSKLKEAVFPSRGTRETSTADKACEWLHDPADTSSGC